MTSAEDESLGQVVQLLVSAGARRILAKPLAANDNSKNQVYLGGDFGVLNVLPAGAPEPKSSGSHDKPIFEAHLNLSWLGPDGLFHPAPHAKLILYPQYPEVRFSGFLLGCEQGPSALMGTTRVPGRLLLLGICDEGRILGWVGSPDGTANQEFQALSAQDRFERIGVFHSIPIPGTEGESDRAALLSELRRIHGKGWIESKRLSSTGGSLPCLSQKCGGLTLEAELGITPIGYSEPDYRGWEVKQHAVANFVGMSSGPITLMTPEPTGGVYVEKGVIPFIQEYGYPDTRGRTDRRNFGGVHRAGETCKKTGLTLTLLGYDHATGHITDPGGGIALIDGHDTQAAMWHYSGLMAHWNRKHASAAYLPSMMRTEPHREYKYGPSARLGVGTDFLKFLSAVNSGEVYYDPGIKAESWSHNPVVKRRSQFRIKSKGIAALYDEVTTISLL